MLLPSVRSTTPSKTSVGAKGLSRGQPRPRAWPSCARALDKIRHWHDSDELPLLKLPARRDDLAALSRTPSASRSSSMSWSWASGGSSLSGKTLVALKDQGFGPAQGPAQALVHGQCRSGDLRGADRAPAARPHGLHCRSPSRAARPRRWRQLFAVLDGLEAKVGKASVATNCSPSPRRPTIRCAGSRRARLHRSSSTIPRSAGASRRCRWSACCRR